MDAGALNDSCLSLYPAVAPHGVQLCDAVAAAALQDFADYVEGRGGARTYTSSPMAGWLWWW